MEDCIVLGKQYRAKLKRAGNKWDTLKKKMVNPKTFNTTAGKILFGSDVKMAISDCFQYKELKEEILNTPEGEKITHTYQQDYPETFDNFHSIKYIQHVIGTRGRKKISNV